MCLLLAMARPGDAGELWLAANRDEELDRPWEPPRLLVSDPPVFGGRDLTAGGSWLAVNLRVPYVVAVTNARLGARPRERSRGALVVELAARPTLADAVASLGRLDLRRYGACNLLLADGRQRWLATNEPDAGVEPVADAVVAVGNEPLAADGGRTAYARERAGALLAAPAGALARELERLLADHGGTDPFCRHGERYGTVCSTIVTIARGAVACYRFAPGPPCRTPFTDLTPAARA